MSVAKKLSVRKLVILYLLDAPDQPGSESQPIRGTTRLQKLIFLLNERLSNQLDDAIWDLDIAYVPEKYGPADLDLYKDLDFLVAAGHIDMGHSVQTQEEPTFENLLIEHDAVLALPEEIEEEELSFEYLMAPSSSETVQTEAPVEKLYRITPKGQHLISRLEKDLVENQRAQLLQVREACQTIRHEFGSWPLKRLLEHVYKNFPDMITESTIRNRVLRR